MKDGGICDSFVEAYVYATYKQKKIRFVHNKIYGGLGQMRYDFFLTDEKTFVEVTGYNRRWKQWQAYLSKIAAKRRYAKSNGCGFKFIRIEMSRKKWDFLKPYLA
jgi:hypothetical protein